jgi:hypothetical protein
LFKSADGAKVILVDVTSTSGISNHAKLHQYTPGAEASYSKLWNFESEKAKLIFFGIELSGCLGPEVYESLSIGFQVNRAIKIIEHIMKRGLFGGFGLGVEEVRGLG